MDTKGLVERVIDLALEEDGHDATSWAVFSGHDAMNGVFTAKEQGCIAGLDIAAQVFSRVDSSIRFEFLVADGDFVNSGTGIGLVRGPTRGILKAERVALNFLQRMSGIATRTAQYVEAVKGTRAIILDTRKTSPGLRLLDKMAVRIGGGRNHRMGLWDMALIKDNHIDAAGSITRAVQRVREVYPRIPIEVEARTLDDVRKVLELNPDRIMLDNFTLADMKRAVTLVDSRVPLEASGGITLETVRDVALTGVDFISVGELTHSVKALDISLTTRNAS
ncbi:MAG: carboxylating nicotinate-nucleotide diphosphorylase [Desulfomonilia bacterium]